MNPGLSQGGSRYRRVHFTPVQFSSAVEPLSRKHGLPAVAQLALLNLGEQPPAGRLLATCWPPLPTLPCFCRATNKDAVLSGQTPIPAAKAS